MTVREYLWRRVRHAMIVQVTVIILAVISAFALPAMANIYVAIVLVFAGLGVVLVMLYRTRCPHCGYPIAMHGPVNLRVGAGKERINYCPHCGTGIDTPYGRDKLLQQRRP